MRDVDPRCLELAEHFCDDRSPRRHGDAEELAQEIQRAVEDWFAGNPPPREEPDGEAFRGHEAAGYFAEQMDRCQRELKR